MNQRNCEAVFLYEMEDLLKSRELVFRVLDMLIVGISKMRHEAFEAQRRAEFRLGKKIGQFVRQHTQSSHPGFDFDVNGVGCRAWFDGGGKCLDQVGTIENGSQPVGGEVRKLHGHGRAQDDEGITDAGLAKRNTFVHRGYAEPVDGQLLQCASNLDRAMSVGISLDDGQHLGMRRQTAHMGNILCESSQINGG